MRVKLAAAAAAMAIGCSGAANAVTSTSYAFLGSNIAPATVAQFDPLHGQLLGYEISWNGSIASSYLNPGYPSPGTYSGTYDAEISFYMVGALLNTHGGDGASVLGAFTCEAGPTCIVVANASGATSGAGDPFFIGNGSFSVTPFSGLSAGLGIPQFTFANIGGTFTYIYESSVPEPATWTLMISGFGLVGSLKRAERVRATSARLKGR